MKTYKIVEEHNNEVSMTGFTSTRKREIESMFSRFIKSLKKDASFDIFPVHQGYVRYTFWGTASHVDGEYYIVCENN
ncbi:MAG: hypothetical protein MJZ26_09080 [Fibrobacter sp.]|nr:hypothetical protein [Fibrobacter sp.]